MMISQIYEKYFVPPGLIDHQIRVAVVGHQVSTSWMGEGLDVQLALKTCLLHDMGNLVKFNFDDPIIHVENISYWKEKKKEFVSRFGDDAHVATHNIIQELELDEINEILKEEESVFGKHVDEVKKVSLEAQILLYSDLRVMPNGISSLGDRVKDLQRRYGKDAYIMDNYPDLEKYIQSMTSIDVESISEDQVAKYRDEFLSVTI